MMSFYLIGKKQTLQYKFSYIPEIKAIYQNNNLLIIIPFQKSLKSIKALKKAIISKLLEWLKAKAIQIITEKVLHYSKLMNVSPQKIRIKNSKTKWGSCSNKGNINFCWRLVMLPNNVIDYVVVHELAHLKEFNHSSHFWREVEKYCPDYRYQRSFLKSLVNLPNYHSEYLFPERLISSVKDFIESSVLS